MAREVSEPTDGGDSGFVCHTPVLFVLVFEERVIVRDQAVIGIRQYQLARLHFTFLRFAKFISHCLASAIPSSFDTYLVFLR
jgi:hypothetical protein